MGKGVPKRQKSLSKRIPNKAKKKIIALRFPRSFHTTYGLDDHLSPPVCLRKKKILSLSLSVVLSSSSSLCKGEQQHKETRREEEMTFSAKL